MGGCNCGLEARRPGDKYLGRLANHKSEWWVSLGKDMTAVSVKMGKTPKFALLYKPCRRHKGDRLTRCRYGTPTVCKAEED